MRWPLRPWFRAGARECPRDADEVKPGMDKGKRELPVQLHFRRGGVDPLLLALADFRLQLAECHLADSRFSFGFEGWFQIDRFRFVHFPHRRLPDHFSIFGLLRLQAWTALFRGLCWEAILERSRLQTGAR